jgi:phosphoglycerate dehydrogenase-like enzyme
MAHKLNILIASYLEPEYVEQIRAVAPESVEVFYEPELLGTPRYPADHTTPIMRTPEQEAYWLSLLAQADILFDFDYTHVNHLAQLAPRLRWVQASSAGIGQLVKRTGLIDTDIIFTTASGIHAIPLAEFCLMSMLMFVKDVFHLNAEKENRHWARYCGEQLAGKTLGVVGLGRVGSEVARLGKCMGMYVIGTKRTTEGVDPASLHVDELIGWTELHTLLRQSDFVVLITPHTPETDGMIGAEELRAMKQGAVLINIARGAIVDEAALIQSLQSGHLGGAALDVFAQEPLPPESPLWELPNVLISPHSASTVSVENAKLTERFCDNLRRFLADEPLQYVFNRDLLY